MQFSSPKGKTQPDPPKKTTGEVPHCLPHLFVLPKYSTLKKRVCSNLSGSLGFILARARWQSCQCVAGCSHSGCTLPTRPLLQWEKGTARLSGNATATFQLLAPWFSDIPGPQSNRGVPGLNAAILTSSSHCYPPVKRQGFTLKRDPSAAGSCSESCSQEGWTSKLQARQSQLKKEFFAESENNNKDYEDLRLNSAINSNEVCWEPGAGRHSAVRDRKSRFLRQWILRPRGETRKSKALNTFGFMRKSDFLLSNS